MKKQGLIDNEKIESFISDKSSKRENFSFYNTNIKLSFMTWFW